MRRTLFLLLGSLLLCLRLSAQSLDLAFFHVDTVGRSNDCALPMIYFEEDRSEIVEEYNEDIAYLAKMLHLYPEMKLRIRTDGMYKRFDNRQRRLNKRRVNKMGRTLKKEYGVPKSRLIKIYHQPWVYRSARSPEPPPLVYRRVICECLWR
ncbi:MAG: hypothetical protein AAF587_00240 [Bacteroidota bacterium]